MVAQTLDRDVMCVGCGYNLRGVDAKGRCPECGLTIERSLRAREFGAARIEWLRRMRAATASCRACMVAVLLAPLWGPLAVCVGNAAGLLMAGTALQLAWVVGVVLLTRRPVAAAAWSESWWSPRPQARGLAVGSLLGSIITTRLLSGLWVEAGLFTLAVTAMAAAGSVVQSLAHVHSVMRWGAQRAKPYQRARRGVTGIILAQAGAFTLLLLVPLPDTAEWVLVVLVPLGLIAAAGWAAAAFGAAARVFARAVAARERDTQLRRGDLTGNTHGH